MTDEHVYDAIILGAGFGGLGAGAEFTRQGLNDFLIIERADDVGGVWRDNVYPGAACDTQSVIYCYSYFFNPVARKMYAGQAELHGYLTALVEEFDLRSRIRLGVEITSAVWDESAHQWRIATTAGEYRARSFIPAWGQLGTPLIPEIPGAASFRGRVFHSARWDTDLDLTGLRVGSIGAAASAVQYVPEVAQQASHLVVFQRSANYILPRNQENFSPERMREFAEHPESYLALRTAIHRQREDGFARVRHDTSEQARGVDEARAHLEAQISDPELRAQLTPDYEFGCKRILRSDDYYPALARDNVRLVTDPIARISERGIVLASGEEIELDVIIYGTGFRSQAFHDQTRVIGRNGADLSVRWGTDPEGYLGITVDGFPNMFLVYGPNTNLNHNSVVTMLEMQHRYIAQAIAYLREHPDASLEVRAERLAEFNAWLQHELEASSYSADCSSWYKNAAGKVINNWCGTADEYAQATAQFDLADFIALETVATTRGAS